MTDAPRLEQVLVEASGGVATVTLNRPEQRNPLSATMLRDLASAFRWSRDEPAVRVIVLTGAGRVFCAGADLASFGGHATDLDKYRSRDLFVDLFILMAELGKPVVGRINGHALAGGFGLACSCDILVAVDTATFGLPEVNVGIWPMMIQAILSRNIPRKALLELEMLGERVPASRLQALGVVNRVVPQEQLDSTVAEICATLARKSPIAMRLGRDSFYRHEDMDFRSALHYLHGQFMVVSETDDSREGIHAFFEKREPEFKGT